MTLYMKIGSMPAGYMHAVRKRKLPVVGETFKVKPLTARGRPEKYARPEGVRLLEVRDVGQPLYVVERW